MRLSLQKIASSLSKRASTKWLEINKMADEFSSQKRLFNSGSKSQQLEENLYLGEVKICK